MIIAFEGLSCVGKTSLIQSLQAALPFSIVVPEILTLEAIGAQPARHGEEEGGFYIRNDWAKSLILAAAVNKKVILLDRYYISTVCYKLALQSRIPRQGKICREIRRLFYSAVQPDIWVYLRSDPSHSYRRSKTLRGSSLDGLWRSEEGVRRIYDHYELAFQMLPVLFSNSTVLKVPPEAASDDVVATREVLRRIICSVSH